MKHYKIKIPSTLEVIYSQEHNLLILRGPLTQKSLKLKVEIILNNKENTIEVKSQQTGGSNKKKKNLKKLQGTTVALIKQLIIESRYSFYKKLTIVGIGYRTLDLDKFANQLLFLKLGYSHPICLKIPTNVSLFLSKRTSFFLSSNSLEKLKQTASFVRSYKKPEPYKGKGLLYEGEKITLKEGKKI